MTEPSRDSRVTTLFPNTLLNRVERLRIVSMRRFTDKRRGEHLHGCSGTSTEFTDYRDYVPGDDVRRVDWNIFARLNRPYLKLYRQEEEMNVVLLVDASLSMSFERKIEQAKGLAGAFGVMGLLGTERVSVAVFNGRENTPARLLPCAGRASMHKVFGFLEKIEAAGDEPLDEGIETFLKYHTGRGIAVLLSDFLTFGDLKRSLNRLTGAGLEIFAVQVLGPAELSPEVDSDVRLVDSETGDTLDVSPGELLEIYSEYREEFQRNLALMCRQRLGRFVSVASTDSLEWVLLDLLRRRGWVK